MKLDRNLRRDFFLSGIASHSSRVNMPLYFGFEVAQVSRHSLVGRVHLVQLLRPMECACGEGIILTLLQDVNPWTNGGTDTPNRRTNSGTNTHQIDGSELTHVMSKNHCLNLKFHFS